MAGLKAETWQDVEKLTMFSKPKEYDQATQLLRDLHEIARRLGFEGRRRCPVGDPAARPAGLLTPVRRHCDYATEAGHAFLDRAPRAVRGNGRARRSRVR